MLVTPTRTDITPAAEWCIARFAALETDVASAAVTGAAPGSGVRSPRLGGLLHGRLAAGSHAATLVTAAAEGSMRAGYELALDADGLADAAVQHTDPDELWAAFLRAGSRPPRRTATTTPEVRLDDERWTGLLLELRLVRDANRMSRGRVSPLTRSIAGLRAAGATLAIAERGARRVARGHRRECRALLASPRPVLDRGR